MSYGNQQLKCPGCGERAVSLLPPGEAAARLAALAAWDGEGAPPPPVTTGRCEACGWEREPLEVLDAKVTADRGYRLGLGDVLVTSGAAGLLRQPWDGWPGPLT